MKLRTANIFVLLMIAAGALAVAAAAFFLILPSLREIRGLAGKIIDAQTELEAQYANRRQLLSGLEKIREVRESMNRLSAQFVPAKQELAFITAIEEIAVRRGVVERLRLSPAAGKPPVEELKEAFELNFDGPFPAVFAALVDVERLPALLIVDSLAIRSSKAERPGEPTPVSLILRGSVAVPPKGL